MKFYYYKFILKILKLFLSADKFAEFQGVKLGFNCRLNKSVSFGSEPYLVSIGNDFYCSVNIFFITHDGAVNVIRTLFPELKNVDYIKPIVVGDNVFIGCNSTILPGAKIGSNVIIGAGSVVTGALDDNSVYAGVPAKKLMSLDSFCEKRKSDFIYTHHLNQREKKEYLKRIFNV